MLPEAASPRSQFFTIRTDTKLANFLWSVGLQVGLRNFVIELAFKPAQKNLTSVRANNYCVTKIIPTCSPVIGIFLIP